MGTKLVKIGEDIYNKVKELAEKQNKTIREITEKAISLYLQGYEIGQIDKEIKGIVSKPIVVQFNAKCFICKKPINYALIAFLTRLFRYSSYSSTSLNIFFIISLIESSTMHFS